LVSDIKGGAVTECLDLRGWLRIRIRIRLRKRISWR
jgi:hypothetical protein